MNPLSTNRTEASGDSAGRLLFYRGSTTRAASLERYLDRQPGIDLDLAESRDGLTRKPRRPLPESLIVILTASGRYDLELFFTLERLLEGRRIILVLDGDDPYLVTLAHRLRPRYLAFLQDNPEELVAVLRKMAARAGSSFG